MAENKKTPKVRFAGFTDSWKRCKLSDFAEIVGGGTPDTNNPAYWDGDIDWYAPAEMEDQRYAINSVRKITELGLHKSSAKVLPALRTVLFTSRAGIGKMAILRHPAATNQGFQSLVLKDETDPYFIYSMGDIIKNMAEGVASGSTFLEISGRMLGTLEVVVPTFKEQKEIALFFRSIDDLIEFHKHKYDHLKKIKKSMLEKMFPRNDSNVPEIRFAGFTGAWERRKFSEIAATRRGLTYKPGDIVDRGKRVLRSSNINEDIFEIHEDDVFVNEGAVNIPYVKDGDILITSANGSSRLVGKHAIVRDIPDNCAVHGGFMLLASSDEPEFVNALMSSQWYTKFINIFVAGGNGAIGNLNKNDLDEQTVLVPSKNEREKIGAYFSSLDNLITLHQRKYEKLRQIKKSLLEKMFV